MSLLYEENSPTETYKVGDLLVVEFKTDGKKAETTSNYYVGEVIELLQTDLDLQYYCKFMRKFSGPRVPENTFIFPEANDLCVIDKSMVMQKLDALGPTIRLLVYKDRINMCLNNMRLSKDCLYSDIR